ncbi:hypothetical protein [Burkholderia sp. D-99]|uniref:hypothetical protein n=1 Tax=Burkholderia sp. D-99 TaxID=2717316 RepID=UPI001420C5EE|nr:hypothetical protein [Burkholderia sp. D-99]NHV25342.1 hypothetical protein [Burkholderia sp. D-99]
MILREICELLIALRREDELVPWAERAEAFDREAADFLVMPIDLAGSDAPGPKTR